MSVEGMKITRSSLRKLAQKTGAIVSEAAVDGAAQRAAQELADKILNQKGNFKAGRQIAQAMGQKVEESTHHKELARNLSSCMSSGHLELYENGHKLIPSATCHGQKKLCPFHARQEMKRRVKKYSRPIAAASKKYRLQLGTLSVRNIPQGGLAEGMEDLWAAFTLLRRRTQWYRPVVGALAKMETTWNDDRGDWNLHFHILAAMEFWSGVDGDPTDFSYEKVLDEWRDAADQVGLHSEWHWWKPVSIYIEGSVEGAAKEILKYTSPFYVDEEKKHVVDLGRDTVELPDYGKGLLQMPARAFGEWFHAWRGQRDLRSYGLWNGQSKDTLIRDDDDELVDLGEFLATVKFLEGPERFEVYSIHDHKYTASSPSDTNSQGESSNQPTFFEP
jgi:hypothetical protein